MESDSKPPLFQIFLLLCFSAYLAFSETAFASVSKNKLRIAADRGDSRARNALWVVNNLERAITTILICNNISHIWVATIITIYVTNKWGITFVSLSTIATTMVVFFFCELFPKTLAKRYNYKISLSCASFLKFLMHFLKPFAVFLSFIGKKVSDRTKDDTDSIVTEDEIQNIIEDMTEEGSIAKDQGDLITSAMQFGNIKVKDILTPRMNVSALDISKSPKEIFNFIKNQTHSRIPVYKGTIDNIVGILGIRQFLKAYMRNNGKNTKLKNLMDKAYFVHESTEIHELLPLMSKHKINIAIVKDSYNGTAGIITVEDILEELVGDIYDESDVIENPLQTKKTIIKENLFLDSALQSENNKAESDKKSYTDKSSDENINSTFSINNEKTEDVNSKTDFPDSKNSKVNKISNTSDNASDISKNVKNTAKKTDNPNSVSNGNQKGTLSDYPENITKNTDKNNNKTDFVSDESITSLSIKTANKTNYIVKNTRTAEDINSLPEKISKEAYK